MKKSIMILTILFLLSMGLHAQNQFTFKIDTASSRILGFNTQNKRLSLSVKKPADLKYPALAFQESKNIKKVFTNNTAIWNMPIFESKGNHTMPVHSPDSAISYSLEIVQPKKD